MVEVVELPQEEKVEGAELPVEGVENRVEDVELIAEEVELPVEEGVKSWLSLSIYIFTLFIYALCNFFPGSCFLGSFVTCFLSVVYLRYLNSRGCSFLMHIYEYFDFFSKLLTMATSSSVSTLFVSS